MLLLAAYLLCPAQQDRLQLPDVSFLREMRLNSVDKGGQFTLIQAENKKLESPKLSPLNGWSFEHVTSGYARDNLQDSFNLRVRVFNQYRPDANDPTDYVARMLMRFWEFNRWRLNVDHSSALHLKSVDVYLCAGGEPGAEQKTMEDPYQSDASGGPARVSNIYVYSVPTLKDRIEFAREIAHEYGHATWPPMGGYTGPEEWVSGDMGERVFMMWLVQALKANKLSVDDVMQAPMADLQKYFDVSVLPDLKRVATKGVNRKLLEGRGKEAYAEALGMVTYAAALLPPKVFGRALLLTKDRRAANFEQAIFEAIRETTQIELTVPEGLRGLAIWVPLAQSQIKGAKVLATVGKWAKIQPTSAKMSLLTSI